MANIPNDLLEGFLLQEDKKHHDQTYTNIIPQPVKVQDHYTQAGSMDGFLKDLQSGKMMSMQEMIDDIEELIETRKDLQKEVFGDVNKLMSDINNFMTAQADRIGQVEILQMKEKLLDIEEFKLQEKINAFRDIALLKKELRDRVQEFKEQGSRIDVIDDLLGSDTQ